VDVLVRQINPALRAAYGVGADTAAQLLVTDGTNPHRLRNDAPRLRGSREMVRFMHVHDAES
jgi:hypothetical protein